MIHDLATPTEPMGMGGISVALDALGNPVCPGCGHGAFTAAALANSGSTRTCLCPPDDPRLDPTLSRADLQERVTEALDHLERLGHAVTCNCRACEAVTTLRRTS